ncbi:MAG: hypothetical protein ACE5DW_05195 [Thermodesulfobacteriota bacterium]
MEKENDNLEQSLNELLTRHLSSSMTCCNQDNPFAKLIFQVGKHSATGTALKTKTLYDADIDLTQATINTETLKLAGIDTGIIKNILDKHPAEVMKLLRELQSGKIETVFAIAKDIGLTEEKFKEQGGGFFGLLVLAVVIVLVAATPTSIEADPIPMPETGVEVDDETAADIDSYLGD